MDIFTTYQTDLVAEEEGREFDKEFGHDVSFKIGRAGSRTYQRMLQTQFDAHKHTLEDKSSEEAITAGEARAEKITVYVMARTILLGWSGNVKYKGEPLPYSIENAEMLLNIKDFRSKVNVLSADFKNFRLVAEETDAKKSASTSNGLSPGDQK